MFIMKASLQRSNSYSAYSYQYIPTSDTDDSVIEEGQEYTPNKIPRIRRIVSYPGANSQECSEKTLTASVAESYELKSYDMAEQKDPAEIGELICDSDNNDARHHGGRHNVSLNHRNRAIAAFLFVVSLVLHFYALSIFFTKNQDSPDNTSSFTNIQDSFRGVKHDVEQVGCLLTINYTDYVKVVDDSSRNCRATKDNTVYGNKTQMIGDLYTSLDCVCTKQVPEKRILKKFKCSTCSGFPECQNGGHRMEDSTQFHVYDKKCGVCDCLKESNFTGNYCHLPKKLECVKCNGTSCNGLPSCNNSTMRPCMESFDSQKMNCTKPVNLDVRDCSSQMTTTESKESSQMNTTESKEYQPKASKTENFMLNTTDHAQKRCSRDATIGYFVIDWIVFIGIIMQFTFVLSVPWCKCDVKDQLWKGYIFCVLLLIIIPPIINCVTCCSTTCDTLGKLFPFIKCLSLVLTVFLLYR